MPKTKKTYPHPALKAFLKKHDACPDAAAGAVAFAGLFKTLTAAAKHRRLEKWWLGWLADHAPQRDKEVVYDKINRAFPGRTDWDVDESRAQDRLGTKLFNALGRTIAARLDLAEKKARAKKRKAA